MRDSGEAWLLEAGPGGAAPASMPEFEAEPPPDLRLGISAQGVLVHANEAACRLLGRSRAELLAATFFEIAPSFSPSRWGAVWNLLEGGGPTVFDTHLLAADGSVRF